MHTTKYIKELLVGVELIILTKALLYIRTIYTNTTLCFRSLKNTPHRRIDSPNARGGCNKRCAYVLCVINADSLFGCVLHTNSLCACFYCVPCITCKSSLFELFCLDHIFVNPLVWYINHLCAYFTVQCNSMCITFLFRVWVRCDRTVASIRHSLYIRPHIHVRKPMVL